MASSPLSIRDQFRIAQGEDSSQEELQHLWNTSKSVTVRKAIASNPNAGPGVLREACRLYIEEVLSNTGFAMLELFDDDKWVRKLSLAYSDPGRYAIEAGSQFYHSKKGTDTDNFCWAMLLSPEIKGWVVVKVLEVMSVGALRRALKNEKLKLKLRQIYKSELCNSRMEGWPYTLSSVLILHRESVITSEQLYTGLSQFAPGSVSAYRPLFVRYIETVHKMYEEAKDSEQRTFAAKLLARSILVTRAHTMQWISIKTHEALNWGGRLYAEAMQFIKAALTLPSSTKRKKNLGDTKTTMIRSVICSYIHQKYNQSLRTSSDITSIYEFVRFYGIEDLGFITLGVTVRGEDDVKALARCPIEVKEFFCRNGCLGTWVSASGSDPRYSIIDEVNEHAYKTGGASKLLFDQCSIRKVISLGL